jgi:non-heme chloroperoxidase
MRTFVPLRDGERLSVQVIGRGPPVMLLHGFGSRANHWLPNALPLAHRHRFVMPDLRGFGESHDVPLNGPDVLATYARDVEDVLDHLGLDKVRLAGISMGACTAMKFFALGNAHRVTHYLNVDQSPKTRNADDWAYGVFGERQREVFDAFRRVAELADAHPPDTPYHALPAVVRREMRETIGTFFAFAFSRRHHQIGVRWFTRHAEKLLTTAFVPVSSWRSYLTVMRAYLEEEDDLRPGLRALVGAGVPLTVVVGMRSEMYPPEGQLRIRESAPHAQIVRFERSGHVPMLDEPLLFQRTFRRFLGS